MNKPKLLFVYDMRDTSKWMDGLWAALNLLEVDFEISKYNLAKNLPPKEPDGPPFPDSDWHVDFTLGWGGFGSQVDNWLQHHPYKRALCIGGNTNPSQGMENYNVLFYETKWVRDFLSLHLHSNIIHAFGVNTDIYNEIDISVPIVWDYIGVGSLAAWKRWSKMSDKRGNKLVIGEYQLGNEPESLGIAQDLLKAGVMVSNMVSPFDLANFYHWSRTLYMPSDIYGGGERAVLEARACGLNVEIEDDNPKLKELLESPIYDHHYYAEQLKKGIMSVL